MRLLFTLLFIVFFSFAHAQMTFKWTQVEGPVMGVIENPDMPSTDVTGLNIIGIYKFELAVSNEFGTGYDTCTVTVSLGPLAVTPDSNYRIERPVIKELEIKVIARSGDIFVQIKSPKVQKISCSIYDMLGRYIGTIEILLKTGTNLISLPKPRLRGVYILKFRTYTDNITQKLLI